MQTDTCKIVKEVRETEMDNFTNQFNKLKRHALKLGLPEPTFKVIQTHVPKEREDCFFTHEDKHYYANILEIEDVDIHIGGWKLVGVIDNKNVRLATVVNGKLVNGALYTTFEKLPKECYEKPVMECEHCHFNRYRNTLYILKNEETGEYKQVGSSCVEDFILTKNVAQIVDYINKWYSGTVAWESEESENEEVYIMTDYLLPIAVEIVDTYGFNTMNSSSPSWIKMEHALKEEYNASKEAYEKASKIREFYESKNNTFDSDFKNNMAKTVCSYSIIPTTKSYTYLLVAVRDYNKEMERADIKKEHYGEVGEKYEFDDAEFLGAYEFSTVYGTALKLSFKWNGYRLSALTNLSTRNADTFKNMEKHTIINIIAKVKKHDIYKDEYYTCLTGIKLV